MNLHLIGSSCLINRGFSFTSYLSGFVKEIIPPKVLEEIMKNRNLNQFENITSNYVNRLQRLINSDNKDVKLYFFFYFNFLKCIIIS